MPDPNDPISTPERLAFANGASIPLPLNGHALVISRRHLVNRDLSALSANMPPTIQSLDLSANLLSDISFLSFPKLLTTLSIASNHISHPEHLRLPASLQSLDLSANGIDTTLPSRWQRVQRYLSLSSEVPAELNKLSLPQGLLNLDLSRNTLPNITGLSLPLQLRSLNMNGSGIVDARSLKLPDLLQAVHLNENHLTEFTLPVLPTGLHTLYLGHNNISDISKISLPAGLTSLDLGKNAIKTISHTEFPKGLEDLDLSGNKITDIRLLQLENTARFPQLKRVFLEHNPLKDKSIEYLRHLPKAAPEVQFTNRDGVTETVNRRPRFYHGASTAGAETSLNVSRQTMHADQQEVSDRDLGALRSPEISTQTDGPSSLDAVRGRAPTR